MDPKKTTRVLFLNLTAFSRIGGAEKYNKCLLKALHDLEQAGRITAESVSLHDRESDENYFPGKKYKGFGGSKMSFVIESVRRAKKFDQVILSHINLAMVGFFLKILFPRKRVILIVHGLEGWQRVYGFKKFIVRKANLILTSSGYTKMKLIDVLKVKEDHIRMFYNTIDPYFPMPVVFEQNSGLRKRYELTPDDYVLFTLNRLSHSEMYKGYDTVIKCLPTLLKTIPNLKYVIAGKYDNEEKSRVDAIIKELNLEKTVIIPGFIKDTEIIEHYQMADVFIMPSHREGFGIVFIEAMFCGLPVIAGNQDGSVEALQNGALGTLVNPFSMEEITQKIREHFENRKEWTAENRYKLQQKALSFYSFDHYKNDLEEILSDDMAV